MVRRLILIGSIAAAVVVSLVSGGAYWFLHGGGVRLALEEQASQWLGQPVTIGSASVQIFPRIGIALRDVRAGEPVRMTLADVNISMALRPLLARRIEQAQVVISNSRLDLPLPFVIPASSDSTALPEQAGEGIRVVSVSAITLRDVTVASHGREITVSADSSLSNGRLELERFSASAGRTALQASGTAQLKPNLDAQLQVSAKDLDLDDLVALANAFAPKADPRPRSSAPSLPGRIVAQIQADSARASGLEIQQFAATLVAQGNRITLSPATFQLFGGRYQGSVDIDSDATGLKATVRTRLDGLDVARLAEFGGVPDTITGSLSGSGTFTGRGATISDALASTTGEGSVTIAKGALKRLGLVRTVVLYFGRPAPDAGSSTDNFDRIEARFAIARQVLAASSLSLHSPDLDLVAQGTLAIPMKALDGTADLQLSEALSAQAGHDLLRYTREGNRVVLPATLGGTLDAPRVNINAKAAVGRGLRNEAQRRLKGLLDGLGRGTPD